MTSDIETLLVRNLFEVFGERDVVRRRQAIADIWTTDCVFADHDGVRSGRDALAASVAALQAKFPSFVFTQIGSPQVIANAGRLAWGFGPAGAAPKVTGLDVAVVRDGRIAALYTFLDPTPV